MSTLDRRRLSTVAFSLALLAAVTVPLIQSSRPAPRYTVTDLGVLPGGAESHAYGLNALGVVCGATEQSQGERACVFQNGKVMALSGLPGAMNSAAIGINVKGESVGRVMLPAIREAFLDRGGKTKGLGTLPGFSGSVGNAINDRGEVAGNLVTDRVHPGLFQEQAFLYSHGTMIKLGSLPGTLRSEAFGINSAGQVVGYCYLGLGRFRIVPFLYDPRRKTMAALPLPPSYLFGRAYAINDRGQAAGQISGSVGTGGAAMHAVIWSSGKLLDMGVPQGYDDARAEGLNNRGEAVGQCFRETTSLRAFLQRYAGHNNPWQRYIDRDTSEAAFVCKDGRIQDLNDLITQDDEWRLVEAHGINDRGEIAGTGLHHGQERAFLLTPR